MVMKLTSMLCLMLLCACQTKVVVIPADKAVKRVEASKSFTPSINGWFVPDARMQEIIGRLGGLLDDPKGSTTNRLGSASSGTR